jgi:hypothetical protein
MLKKAVFSIFEILRSYPDFDCITLNSIGIDYFDEVFDAIFNADFGNISKILPGSRYMKK